MLNVSCEISKLVKMEAKFLNVMLNVSSLLFPKNYIQVYENMNQC